MNHILPTVFISILSLAWAVRAQEKIPIRTLALRPDEIPGLLVHDGKEYSPLEFSAVQPGEVVMAQAANPLPLLRSGTGADGKEGHVVAHRVKLPTLSSGILLLGWKEGEEARFIAIKDDFAKAAYNDWLFINASTRPVAFKAGEKATPLLLKPGVSTTHRIGAAKGEGVAATAQAPIKGKNRTFFSTFWPAYPDKRSVVIFVDDGEKILCKRISDELSKPKTKKPEE